MHQSSRRATRAFSTNMERGDGTRFRAKPTWDGLCSFARASTPTAEDHPHWKAAAFYKSLSPCHHATLMLVYNIVLLIPTLGCSTPCHTRHKLSNNVRVTLFKQTLKLHQFTHLIDLQHDCWQPCWPSQCFSRPA